MSGFSGVGALIGLALRRDRVRTLIWIVAAAGIVVPSFSSFSPIYTNQQAIDVYATFFIANPGAIAMTGPGHGLDLATPDNLGPLAVNEMSMSTILAMALLGIFFVVRNTRAEEQEGRTELLRAGNIGLYAPVASALIVTSGVALVIGLLFAVGLIALGFPAAGSFAFGLSMAMAAIVFGAVAAVAAQLAENSRAAIGLSLAAFAAFFVIRATGDVRDNWLTWLSPIGWIQWVRPYADERWWVLLLPLALTAVLALVAMVLLRHRDLGAGLIPARLGKARASAALTTPFGLAMRLRRGTLIAWAAGLFLLGVWMGDFALEAERMIEVLADTQAASFIPAIEGVDLVDQTLAALIAFTGMAIAGQALSATVQMRAEESRAHAETLLAGSLSRTRWMATHIGATLLSTFLVLLATGAGTGLGFAAAKGGAAEFAPIVWAALAYTPAIWMFSAVGIALFGLAPRALPAVWGLLTWVLFAGWVGPLLDLPRWVLDLTPFAYVPLLPAEKFTATEPLAMLAVVFVLIGVGLVAFRRRDLDLQ